MPVKSVRGKECDINGTFLGYLSSNAILECIDHATDFILHNRLSEYMGCFPRVLSPSDIEWEGGETSLSYLGDNGESYTVYREPQTKVLCNHDQDGLVTHPGYPDPDESGSQLKENPEQGKTPVNPEPS